MKPTEARRLAQKRTKDGRTAFWLQPKDYAIEKFREAWDRIGSGLSRGEAAVEQ
jgi:hypothetical protein